MWGFLVPLDFITGKPGSKELIDMYVSINMYYFVLRCFCYGLIFIYLWNLFTHIIQGRFIGNQGPVSI